MSLGPRLSFEDAYQLGQEAAEQLRPTVDVLKAVGSLRRKRDSIGDIEFLARPHSNVDLFEAAAMVDLQEITIALHRLGTWVRGGPRMMQITNLLGRPGMTLELYLVHPAGCTCRDCAPYGPSAWGSMLAIRTGPEELGRYCVTRMRARGYRHAFGQVRQIGSEEVVPTETEEDFFELAGVTCLSPKLRDEQADGLWKAYEQRRRQRA